VLAALALLAPVAPARAQARLTQQEALALAFPGADSVARRTAYLSEADLRRVQALAGPGSAPPPAVVSYYTAWHGRQPIGVAYFDVHRVRTEREVLMFVLDAGGMIRRVEVLAFAEPPEYAPPKGWLGQFAGLDSAAAPNVARRIAGITGASLTTRAAERAARRVLALHAVIRPFGNPGARP
jgi:hypothetical protein